MLPETEERRPELAALCRRFGDFGVRRLEVFGSAAAGPFRQERTALDFLVEFEPPLGPGYAERYLGLLEALFGRPVDLVVVVASAVKNPYFRESVDRTGPCSMQSRLPALRREVTVLLEE
jgi:predicted nucleotidyltransferase